MGVFTALALSVHNIPEGVATFIGSLASPKLGASVAIAIGIHNIPEGFAVSVPLYFGRKGFPGGVGRDSLVVWEGIRW